MHGRLVQQLTPDVRRGSLGLETVAPVIVVKDGPGFYTTRNFSRLRRNPRRQFADLMKVQFFEVGRGQNVLQGKCESSAQ